MNHIISVARDKAGLLPPSIDEWYVRGASSQGTASCLWLSNSGLPDTKPEWMLPLRDTLPHGMLHVDVPGSEVPAAAPAEVMALS